MVNIELLFLNLGMVYGTAYICSVGTFPLLCSISIIPCHHGHKHKSCPNSFFFTIDFQLHSNLPTNWHFSQKLTCTVNQARTYLTQLINSKRKKSSTGRWNLNPIWTAVHKLALEGRFLYMAHTSTEVTTRHFHSFSFSPPHNWSCLWRDLIIIGVPILPCYQSCTLQMFV